MAALGTFAETLLLNCLLKATTTGVPSQWGIGIGTAVGNSGAGSELAAGSGYSRQSGFFLSAAAGTFVNSSAATFGPVFAAGTFSGINVWDLFQGTAYTANAGNLLLFGSLATARTLASGDSLVLASGAMSITLA